MDACYRRPSPCIPIPQGRCELRLRSGIDSGVPCSLAWSCRLPPAGEEPRPGMLYFTFAAS